MYKDGSGRPLLVATVGKGDPAPGTKAIVTTLPPVSFEKAPNCEGDVSTDHKEKDESDRYWGFEVRVAYHGKMGLSK